MPDLVNIYEAARLLGLRVSAIREAVAELNHSVVPAPVFIRPTLLWCRSQVDAVARQQLAVQQAPKLKPGPKPKPKPPKRAPPWTPSEEPMPNAPWLQQGSQ